MPVNPLRSRIRLTMAIALVALVTQAATAQFPGIPRLPGPSVPGLPSIPIPGGTGSQEPWFATSLADARTDVPFLDGYRPRVLVPMHEMPPAGPGEFLLGPGAYDLWAQSYCLTAGAHGPARGKGKGYVVAPPRGKGAYLVRKILRAASQYPDVPQRDIQVLLWAAISRTPFNDMNANIQRTAERLLDKKDVDSMRRSGGMAPITNEVFHRVMGYLPPVARQIFNAEATLRGMFTSTLPGYAHIEAVAVQAGVAPFTKGDREIPAGRWSYDPRGYFVAYHPHGYQGTLIQVQVPGNLRMAVDGKGRITRLADDEGNVVETDYDDARPTVAVSGDGAVKGYAFRAVRVRKTLRHRPGQETTVDVSRRGFVLLGLPSGDGRATPGPDDFAALPERYAFSLAHRKQAEALMDHVAKTMKPAPSAASRARTLALLVDVASYSRAVSEALRDDARQQGRQPDATLVNPAFEAWQAILVVFGETRANRATRTAPREMSRAGQLHFAPAPSGAAQNAILMADSDDREWGEFRMPERKVPSWLKPFDPSQDVAQPAQQGAQRLGQSARGRDDRKPGDDSEEGDDPSIDFPNKDILDRARKAMDYIDIFQNVTSLASGPSEWLAGKIPEKMGMDFQGSVKDWMFDFIFDKAEEISRALGGDPPRPDFDQVAVPQPLDPKVVFAGAQALPGDESVLAALVDLTAKLQAAQITRDRLGGAIQARNAEGIIRQAEVLVRLKRDAGLAWIRVADRLDEAAQSLRGRKVVIPPQALVAYRHRLTAQGFTAEQRAAAHRVGMTDADLENLRQRRINATGTGTRDLGETLRTLAATYRALGEMWASLPPVRSTSPGQ